MRTLFLSLMIIAVPGAVHAQASVSATASAGAMSSSATSIGDLLDNPKAKAVLEKHLPEVVKSDQIDMARAMTLKDIQSYAADAITDEKLKAIDAELAALPK
jgi:hypothetical protein